jgi:septal ring factor EnvC (AmiA/AmiB activator)
LKEVIQMFSKELLELDRNTVEFMIEDMRRQIEEKDEQIKQLDEQIKQKDEQLRQLDEQIKESEQGSKRVIHSLAVSGT